MYFAWEEAFVNGFVKRYDNVFKKIVVLNNFSFFCLKYVGNTSCSYEISKNPFSSLKGTKFHNELL